jgi:hypothetical protein
MNLADKDLKMLWGLSAGICSFPGCGEDCIPFVDPKDPTILGEMAHVIAKSPNGPRGSPSGGSDSYENLILLCPTHHRLVDKAPAGKFPESTLHSWKADHEASVRARLQAPTYASRKEMAEDILRQLAINHEIWKNYGPESVVAKTNPASNVATFWTLRKLRDIIPANRRIAAALTSYRHFLSPKEYAAAAMFMEHAVGFEASTYEALDSVPRFPRAFEEMIQRAAIQ